jgi:hypothetical protein
MASFTLSVAAERDIVSILTWTCRTTCPPSIAGQPVPLKTMSLNPDCDDTYGINQQMDGPDFLFAPSALPTFLRILCSQW